MQEEAAQPIREPQGPQGLASRPSPGEQPGEITGTDFESRQTQASDNPQGALGVRTIEMAFITFYGFQALAFSS